LIEKKLDSCASLDRNSTPLLPPDGGTVPGFNKALTEHVIEHVFQISELVIRVLELDELSSRRDVNSRSKAVRDPKLGGHDDGVVLVTQNFQWEKLRWGDMLFKSPPFYAISLG